MIDSTHFLTSKELFILAIQLIINKLEIFINELPKLSINEKTFMTIESMNEDSIFLLIIHGFDDTLGNIIQSYISMNMINDESKLAVCGYKKTHPLEDILHFNISLNPNNNIFHVNQPQKVISIIEVFQEASNELILLLTKIKDEADKKL